ncbi:phosphotransferase [Zavarzinia compransoris]|uniref:phosphotransferase n=1 Tax=Zavarzinia marina TaxID=2911065 RepID=UPI001F3BB665|nr:phosphotransferase [Zavarzinia marina]MCF4164687.1 phosphotransferase [Zavarzinia marina]
MSGTDDVLTTPAPTLSEAAAAALLERHYGLRGALSPLPGERDRNLLLRAEDGGAHILKIANPAEDAAVTDLQVALLRHVEAADPDLPLSRMVPAKNGAFTLRLDLDGVTATVRVLTYLEGEPLHRAPPSPAQARAIGRTLGRLDRALADFGHPAARRELLWDAGRLERVRPLTDHIPDPDARGLVHRVLDRFEDLVVPRRDGLRAQVIHNDLNPHNVLTVPGRAAEVAGIIDVGDALFGALIGDVGTALAYQLDGGDDPFARAGAFLAGFSEIMPLRPEEMEVLPVLIAARLTLTVTIGQWRAAREPDNRDYILRNYPGALRGLERLALLSPAAARDGLVAAMEEAS